MAEIVIPYTPRPIWRDTIHPALTANRFAVLVCHRRFGKTVGTVNEMIKKAVLNEKKAPVYAYVVPYRNQAKRVAWEYLKYSRIPFRMNRSFISNFRRGVAACRAHGSISSAQTIPTRCAGFIWTG